MALPLYLRFLKTRKKNENNASTSSPTTVFNNKVVESLYIGLSNS